MFEHILSDINSSGQVTREHIHQAISECGATTSEEAYAYVQIMLDDVSSVILSSDDKIKALDDLGSYFEVKGV